MVKILHVGCKYNILRITYFIVLIAAVNLIIESSHSVTKICNVLVYSRRLSFVSKHLVLFLIHYGSFCVNVPYLLVKITKYIQCSHIVQFGCRNKLCIMCHHAMSRR